MKSILSVIASLMVTALISGVLMAQTVKIPRIGGNDTSQPPKKETGTTATAEQKPTLAPAATSSEEKTQNSVVPEKNTVGVKENTVDAKEKIAEIDEGVRHFASGNIPEAKKLFEQAKQKHPELQPPSLFMAHLFTTTNQVEEVRYWLEQAAYESPEDPEAFLLLGNFAAAEQRFAEATLLVQKASELLKNIPEDSKRYKPILTGIISLEASVAVSRSDWEAAKKHLLRLRELAPESLEPLIQLGFVSFQQKNVDEALKYYDQALKSGAKIPPVALIVAQLFDKQGNRQEAFKRLNEAVKNIDNDPSALRLAANLALNWGELKQAEELVNKAVKLEPKHVDNLLIAGTIALYKKEFLQAEVYFQDAVLIAPDNLVAKQGLALALVEQSDATKNERALVYARDIVQGSLQTPEAVAVLAWIYFKSDHQLEAEMLLNRLLEEDDLSPLGYYILAEILVSQENNEQAIELLKKAVEQKENFIKREAAETLLKKLQK